MPSPAGVGVIAVTRIKFPFSFFLILFRNSKFILAICLPIGLKAASLSGTLIFAKIFFIGCILAFLAISISDFILLI